MGYWDTVDGYASAQQRALCNVIEEITRKIAGLFKSFHVRRFRRNVLDGFMPETALEDAMPHNYVGADLQTRVTGRRRGSPFPLTDEQDRAMNYWVQRVREETERLEREKGDERKGNQLLQGRGRAMRGALLAATVLTLSSPTANAEEWRDKYFDSDSSWMVRHVKPNAVTLISAKDYPCQVKADGWRVIDSYFRRPHNASWYSLPEKYYRWEFRVVVHNPNAESIKFAMCAYLLTDRQLRLLHDEIDRSDSDHVASVDMVGIAQYNCLSPQPVSRSDKRIKPGLTQVYNRDSSYHAKRGEPKAVTWRVQCELEE